MFFSRRIVYCVLSFIFLEWFNYLEFWRIWTCYPLGLCVKICVLQRRAYINSCEIVAEVRILFRWVGQKLWNWNIMDDEIVCWQIVSVYFTVILFFVFQYWIFFPAFPKTCDHPGLSLQGNYKWVLAVAAILNQKKFPSMFSKPLIFFHFWLSSYSWTLDHPIIE